MAQSLIPLYCLSGFVGVGKTTALMSILRQHPEKKIGVIFTEPAVYLKEADNVCVECLPNGCVQCVCVEEAIPRALEYMKESQPEMVFIEISGLSDPLHVKHILESSHDSLSLYQLQGIICLVDADNFMEQIRDVEMVKRQLSHCHLALINKADLVAPELLTVLQAQIRRINPDCEIVSCSFGGFSLELLEHDLLSRATTDSECADNAGNPDSIVLSCPQPLEKKKILSLLERFKPETYRIKGFCLLEDGWSQIDVVGSRISFTPCIPHSSSRLIFISKIGHALSQPLTDFWNESIGLPMQLHD